MQHSGLQCESIEVFGGSFKNRTTIQYVKMERDSLVVFTYLNLHPHFFIVMFSYRGHWSENFPFNAIRVISEYKINTKVF